MNFPFELTGTLELVWRATWQAVLLAMIVWIAMCVFRRWLTPRWRTLLWTIPLLRFCLLIVPASSVSLYGLVEYRNAPQAPAVNLMTQTATLPLSAEGIPQPAAASGERRRIVVVSDEAGSAALKPVPSAAPQPGNGWTFSTADVLRIVWIAGVAVVCVHWCLSCIFLRRMLSRCRPLADPQLTTWIPQSFQDSDLKRRIRYLVTDENVGPASCGLWRPVVILPQQLLNELTGEELQTVIRHEIVHIRRWDGLLLLLSRLATAIHWFNPLVYFIGRRLRREMELAVDAAAVRGLAEQSRKAYGELLLRLSQRPVGRFGLIEMANSRSEVGKRIDQVFAPPRESRLSAAFAAGLIALLAVSGLTEEALTQEAPKVADKQAETKQGPAAETSNDPQGAKKYFIEGTVRDATNQAPVEGAEIQFFVASEPDLNDRLRHGLTDEQGKYRVEVELGDVKLWNPRLKPGYWLKPEDAIVPLTTSPGRHVVTHDLVAQRGPVWRVKVNVESNKLFDPRLRFLSVYEVENDDVRKAWLKNEPVSFAKSPASSISKLNDQVTCRITEPGNSRKLIINALTQVAELIADPEFDNTRVVSVQPLENSGVTQLIDAQGHKATITAATVTLEKGSPLLTFDARMLNTLATQQLKGQIVDGDERPLSGVKVGTASGQKGGGSGMGSESVQTDAQGRFTLNVPVPSEVPENVNDYRIKLILTKQGFAAKDTGYFPLPADHKPIEAGTIRMLPGYSVPVKVLDVQGNPAAGAVLEPVGSYALRMQAARTNEDGRAVLNNLPVGEVSVAARYGNLYRQSHLIVSPDADENDEVTIRLEPPKTIPETSETLKKPAVEAQAPELKVKEWSDGTQRTLADYRGKVVVLEFWGVWCSGCIAMIPTHQKLADKYGTQGAVFLGIHTADGEMEQINKLKKLKKWTTPTAIDRGASVNTGETCRAFGVSGFPTIVILDREGKIAFRSDIEPENAAEYQAQIAKLAGVPWPPAEDLSEEEQIVLADKIFSALISREMERVLSAGK